MGVTAAAIAAGGAALSAGVGAYSSSQAAGQRGAAASASQAQQLAMFQLGYNTLNPYVQQGQAAGNLLQQETSPGGYLADVYGYNAYAGPGAPTNAPTIAPYSGPGVPTAPNLAPYTGPGVPTAPTVGQFAPTQDQLNNMPGYQFEMAQGLKGIQSANAAKGLGVSGQAMKQAGTYAQGLASTDLQNYYNQWLGNQNLQLSGYSSALAGQGQAFGQYLNTGNQQLNQYAQALAGQQAGFGQWQQGGQMTLSQYQAALQGQAQGFNQWQAGQTTGANIFQTNQQNLYNRLQGQATMGANAAANVGTQAGTAGQGMATAITQGGAAQAAGTMGVGNAIGSGVNALTTPYYQPANAATGQAAGYTSPGMQIYNALTAPSATSASQANYGPISANAAQFYGVPDTG